MITQFAFHKNSAYLNEELIQIEKAKTNPKFFEPIYKKYHEAIFRYVNKRVNEPETAYDITSCVFIKALTALNKFEFRGVPFSSWLFRIAKSELYQSFRDKKVKSVNNIDFLSNIRHIDENYDDNFDDNRQKLLNSLKLLKECEIYLIELRFFERRSFKEMGEVLGLTENNAKVKTFRALSKLKKKFHSQDS
jgi:RNA polymerase sigma-70 factor (ECF subfamily)